VALIGEIDHKVNDEDRENDPGQKLNLEYPCRWRYKLIGWDVKVIKLAVKDILLEREHTIDFSNASGTGKYCSMNLDLLVHNENERRFVYEALKAHQHIKMVL
jgi:putative lipoic acid-binding regulatory protein